MSLYGNKKFNEINKSVIRKDGFEKVTGKAKYAADLYVKDMLYGGMLRSPYSSARVIKIDASEAKKIQGVHSVVTFEDIEYERGFTLFRYLTGRIRYRGDVVAIVAAESKKLVRQALDAIIVEYEELPGVYTIEEALAEGAPQVHDEYPGNIYTESRYQILKGDVEEGFEKADVIIERKYSTQYVEHAYIEPECVLAYQDIDNSEITVHACSHNPFFTRRYISGMLGVPINKVRLIQTVVGGSFGGKEESVGMLAARAAYLARETGRPIKMGFTREESVLESSKRHPFNIDYKIGATKDGKIIALEGTLIDNCGAYDAQAVTMNKRVNAQGSGAYEIENVKTSVFGVFTNNVCSGAFRGYGTPQQLFALEQLIDELAEELGISQVEIRKINGLKTGSKTASSTVIENAILDEMLDYTVEQSQFEKKLQQYKKENENVKPYGIMKGIGLAIANRPSGHDGELADSSGCLFTVMEDGSVKINSSNAENGQGIKTVFSQIAAEALGVKYEDVVFYSVDTHGIPDGGMTTGSRGTPMGSKAVRSGGEKMKEIMKNNAVILGFFPSELVKTADDIEIENSEVYVKSNPEIKVPFSELTNASHWSGLQMGVFEWIIPPPITQVWETGQGRGTLAYTHSCVVAEVEVDLATGYVSVIDVTSSHDLGTVIHPGLTKGQIYGGIVMGQGYAIMESVDIEKGALKTDNLDTYIIPTSLDMPKMTINLFESENDKGTYGAKSVGEPATEVVAAAVANAIYNACGKRIRNNPADLETVLIGKKLK